MLFFALCIIGCAVKQPSLQQLNADFKTNQLAASRIYPGKTAEEVSTAAQKVLYMLDPGDMEFDVRANELLATRMYGLYLVFGMAFGRDWYSVKFTQNDSGTMASFGFQTESSGGLIALAIPKSFRSDIQVSAHQNPLDFKLFHDRIEYLLGIRSGWISCEQAKKEQNNPEREIYLCDAVGLDDRAAE